MNIGMGMALLIAIFSPTIGIMAMFTLRPYIKKKTSKKLPLHICTLLCVVGLIIYISFLMCFSGEHLDSTFAHKEYPIDKMTFNSVYFNDRGGDSLSESWVIVEEPNDKYQNIVLVETEEFKVKWLFCKINVTNDKYHVYLSEDVYNRLQDGNTIYEKK